MKKLALVAVLAGLSLSLYGQGMVNMNTLQGTSAYVKFYDTVAMANPSDPSGATYHVQLYWGNSATTVNTPVAGLAGFASAPAGMVLGSSGGGARQLLDGTTPVTATVWVQLRAWSGALGSYEATAASGNGSLLVSPLTGAGASPIVQVTPSANSSLPASVIPWGGTSASPLVVNLVPVPEPSTIAMVGLGLLGLLFIRRRK